MTDINAFVLPSIPNLSSQDVTWRAPWDGQSTAPEGFLDTKDLHKWQSDPATRHLFYFPYSGPNRDRVASVDNPIEYMHAICVAYNCAHVKPGTLDTMIAEMVAPVRPNFISMGARAIHAMWILPEPLWCGAPDHRARMLKWMMRRLKLEGIFPDFDDALFLDSQLAPFSAGTNWECMSEEIIDAKTLDLATLEAGFKAKFNKQPGAVTIPLDVIGREIEARFPGKWKGLYEDGARGCRFWEADSDPTLLAATMRPQGMLCYTGDRGFLTWTTILGKEFVAKYFSDRIAVASNGVWYDSNDFWVFEGERWMKINKDNLKENLKCDHGINPVVDRKDVASEMDHTLRYIRRSNIVRGSGPFLHNKPGIIYRDGQRYLNTCCATVMQPLDGPAYAEDFPWIANFLGTLFVSKFELDYFLAWFQRLYLSGLNFKPTQGHVLILGGTTSNGKTLLCDFIVCPAMGGGKDASNFLLGKNKFNKAIYECAVAKCNDATPASAEYKLVEFHSRIKAMAANSKHELEAKYVDQLDVDWSGRIMMTCNIDMENIKMIPPADYSMADKLLVLYTVGAAETDVEGRKEMSVSKGFNDTTLATISSELPAFLAFLRDFEVTPEIPRSVRFGYEAYYNPELKMKSDANPVTANFEEILRMYLESFFEMYPSKHEWSGNSTHLLEALMGTSSPVQVSAKSYNPVAIGVALGKLLARKAELIERRARGHRTIYVFKRSAWLDMPPDKEAGDPQIPGLH